MPIACERVLFTRKAKLIIAWFDSVAQYHSVELEGLLLITLFKDEKVALQLLIKHLSPLSLGEVKWLRVPKGVDASVLNKVELKEVLRDQGFNSVFFEEMWVEGGVFLGEKPIKAVFEALGFEVFLKHHKADELWGEKIKALNIKKDFALVDSFYFKATLDLKD